MFNTVQYFLHVEFGGIKFGMQHDAQQFLQNVIKKYPSLSNICHGKPLVKTRT